MELYLFLTIVALLCFLVYERIARQVDQEREREERQDLLDRLMARNFVEYKEQTQEPVRYEPVSVSEEEEYWRELQSKRPS